MAYSFTLYLDSAHTQPVSTAGALTAPVDLGSVQIPATGTTNGTSTAVYYVNGTTTVTNVQVTPQTLTVSGHADGHSEVQVSADNSTWGGSGATVTIAATIAPNATGVFYLRSAIPSTDTPAGTSSNCPIFTIGVSLNDNG